MKACPYCGEHIQQAAVKCRFCFEWLDPSKRPTWSAAETEMPAAVPVAIAGDTVASPAETVGADQGSGWVSRNTKGVDGEGSASVRELDDTSTTGREGVGDWDEVERSTQMTTRGVPVTVAPSETGALAEVSARMGRLKDSAARVRRDVAEKPGWSDGGPFTPTLGPQDPIKNTQPAAGATKETKSFPVVEGPMAWQARGVKEFQVNQGEAERSTPPVENTSADSSARLRTPSPTRVDQPNSWSPNEDSADIDEQLHAAVPDEVSPQVTEELVSASIRPVSAGNPDRVQTQKNLEAEAEAAMMMISSPSPSPSPSVGMSESVSTRDVTSGDEVSPETTHVQQEETDVPFEVRSPTDSTPGVNGDFEASFFDDDTEFGSVDENDDIEIPPADLAAVETRSNSSWLGPAALALVGALGAGFLVIDHFSTERGSGNVQAPASDNALVHAESQINQNPAVVGSKPSGSVSPITASQRVPGATPKTASEPNTDASASPGVPPLSGGGGGGGVGVGAPNSNVVATGPAGVLPGEKMSAEELNQKLSTAKSLYRKRKYEAARDLLLEAKAGAPTSSEVLFLLAQVLVDLKDGDASLQTARECVAIEHASEDCWMLVAVLEEQNGASSKALEAWQKYVELAPSGPYVGPAKKNIAKLQKKAGQ